MSRKVPAMNLNTFIQPIAQDWYRDIGYADTLDIARENLQSAAKSFITIGYCLKHIKENELYKEGNYQNIWECAKAEFGLTQTVASRYMSMNTAFSVEGNTPLLDEKYSEFNKSQLQEMLALPEDIKHDIKPESTVPEIRKIAKEQKKQISKEGSSANEQQLEGRMIIQDYPEVMPDTMSIPEQENGVLKNNTSEELQRWLADLADNKLSKEDILKGFIKHYILYDSILFDCVQDDIPSDGAQVIDSLKKFFKEYCE